MSRSRHPNKDIEAWLVVLESQGWEIIDGKKYRKARCKCGDHQKTIHTSPSDPNYLRNLKGWFRRCDCWKSESSGQSEERSDEGTEKESGKTQEGGEK
ncbi:hypothetical protein [Mycobacteroides abscessus]